MNQSQSELHDEQHEQTRAELAEWARGRVVYLREQLAALQSYGNGEGTRAHAVRSELADLERALAAADPAPPPPADPLPPAAGGSVEDNPAGQRRGQAGRSGAR
jgi:hypothetical protein